MTHAKTAFVSGLLSLLACSSSKPPIANDLDRVAAGGAAGTGGAGAVAAGAAGKGGGEPIIPAACPTGRGPEMVAIALADGRSFCIDTTEVTQGQYATFLDAEIDPKKQSREVCRLKNHGFSPVIRTDMSKGCEADVYQPATKGDRAMSCVGFCDALAFCEWAGKRLCGSTDGGPLPGAEAPTNDKSEWYLACSNGGKTKYPYGDAFEPGRCDSGGKDEPGRPAAESQCAGLGTPFDAIKDMSGGMAEWEDDCVPEGSCRIRGGSAGTQELDTLACTGDMRLTAYLEASTVATVGFRCCADSGPR